MQLSWAFATLGHRRLGEETLEATFCVSLVKMPLQGVDFSCSSHANSRMTPHTRLWLNIRVFLKWGDIPGVHNLGKRWVPRHGIGKVEGSLGSLSLGLDTEKSSLA